MSLVLEAIQISKGYYDGQYNKIFKDVDLRVTAGSMCCISGPSGSGKTTLLNCLSGLNKVDSGIIKVLGNDLEGKSQSEINLLRNQDIGFIYQFHHLLLHLSVQDNVALPAIIAGLDVKDAKEIAAAILSEFNMQSLLQHQACKLSGGERQRVAVARALVNRPKLIIADEPTGSLDQANATKVYDALYQAVQKFNVACVLASHDSQSVRHNAITLKLEQGQLLKCQ